MNPIAPANVNAKTEVDKNPNIVYMKYDLVSSITYLTHS